MRVVVLGAAGFIGGAVCEALNRKKIGHYPVYSSSKYRVSFVDPIQLDREAKWLFSPDLGLKGCEVVYLCAGRTGGVGRMAADPFSFVYANVRIHMNVFEAAVAAGVRRVVCVGSTTGYPNSPEAMTEDQYLTGDLHPAYFVPGNAHRFIKQLAMMHKNLETVFFRPSNVYGPRNSFDPQYSHVIEATVRKVAEKQDPFVIWGTGNEVRDAIYIDDLAEAITLGADCPPGDYNVGSGEEMSVNQIADVLLWHAGHTPKVEHDLSKPTAIPARRVSTAKLRALGWTPKVSMKEGLIRTLEWYESQRSHT